MIKLGEIYQDSITGFIGLATARTEYLFGCVRVCIEPQSLDDNGAPKEAQWFDEQRLTDSSKANEGGPKLIPKSLPNPPKI